MQVRVIFICLFFFFQAEDGIRDSPVTGVQTCALPISEEIDLSAMVMTEITSGEVTGINANTIDDSIVFTLETDDDGVLSVTTSEFLIRPFNDGSFFVLVNGEETDGIKRSEEHTSELQSLVNLVCRLLLEKKKK